MIVQLEARMLPPRPPTGALFNVGYGSPNRLAQTVPSSVACSCDDNDASTIGKFEVIADVQAVMAVQQQPPISSCVLTAVSALRVHNPVTIPDLQDVTAYGITSPLWVHDMVIHTLQCQGSDSIFCARALVLWCRYM